MENETFRDELALARRELVETTIDRLSAAASAAVATLCTLMDVESTPSIRLGAARAVLEHAQRWRGVEAMESRLAVLEALARVP
jgi:hypothetical protein